MRNIKVKTALAAALLTTAACGLAVAQSKQLVFVAWGGTTQEAEMKAWATPFTAETSVPVVSDGPTNYGKIKAMVEAKAVDWDVIDAEGDWAARADKEGLLEKLDFSLIDVKDVDKRFYTDYGAAAYSFSFVLGYNTSAMGGKVPSGWADFFDTEKFPGKRGVISWMTAGVLEMALLADGVKPADLYPLDVERAFRKLDTIKKEIIFWDSGAASQSQIATGETVMCFCWEARVGALKRDGAPVEAQWNQHLQGMDLLVVPKGSKNKELAMKFISHAVSAKGQAEVASAVGVGPVNAKSKDLIDPAIWSTLNAAYPDQRVDVQIDFWRDNGAALSDRWAQWKVQ